MQQFGGKENFIDGMIKYKKALQGNQIFMEDNWDEAMRFLDAETKDHS